MSGNPQRLYLGQPTNSAASIFTCQARNVKVKEVVLANNDSSARTFDLHIVASGGSATASNRIIPTMTVPPNYVAVIDLNTVMNTGESLYAKASVSSTITACISGEVVTE